MTSQPGQSCAAWEARRQSPKKFTRPSLPIGFPRQPSLGVLTDVGTTTAHIESMLSGLEGLMLETNHDLEQLKRGRYPPSLKERISGPFGHLDNGTSASILSRLDRTRLQHLVAAHLSVQNNSPELARAALAPVLGCDPDWINCAHQDRGFGWLSLI